MAAQRIRVAARSVLALLRVRLRDTPYGYPPVVMTIAEVACALLAIVAVAQRGFPPSPIVLLAALLALTPTMVYLSTGWHPIAWVMCLNCAAVQLLFFAEPARWDISPFILVLGIGEISAISSWRLSVPAAALFVGLIVAGGTRDVLIGSPMYATGVLMGWMVGVIVALQMRALEQERASQAERSEQAAAEERRRIAREVHDVVAHSLSVTLLQVTGARMALQQDADIEEAVTALHDAERVGRQAMADIRRTVGLLGSNPAPLAPEPGLIDIDQLVADFRGAGLIVHYQRTGSADTASAATGLCVYRIVQESLTNVLKHAPGGKADVSVTVTSSEVAVAVRNTLAHPATGQLGRSPGFGMDGMRQRAELLGGAFTAGPHTDGWEVTARVPTTEAVPACLGRTIAGAIARGGEGKL